MSKQRTYQSSPSECLSMLEFAIECGERDISSKCGRLGEAVFYTLKKRCAALKSAIAMASAASLCEFAQLSSVQVAQQVLNGGDQQAARARKVQSAVRMGLLTKDEGMMIR